MPTPMIFDRRQRATLDALARCIVPHAYDGEREALVDVVSLLEARLAEAPERLRHEFALGLRVLGFPLARWILCGSATAWEAMPIGERSTRFERLGHSRLGVARTLFQGVRRLVLLSYYTTADGRADAGLLEPLHAREPAFDWEGPAVGATSRDDEPIARVPRGAERAAWGSHQRKPVPGAVTLGSTLTGEHHLTADVVVVGSGAGGAVAAARLAEAGREVVILEEGSYLHAPDFDEDEGRLHPMLFADRGLRSTDDLGIAMLQGGAVGGGTTVNWMVMLRTPDHVLDEWARRFGITGLSPRDMAPVFERIEREVHATRVPDDSHSPSNRVILDGARALGWRATPATINARGCVRAGTCSLGCRYDAKQGGLLTYLPRAFACGARLFANARVDRLEVTERATAGNRAPRKRVHATVLDPGTRAARASLTIDAPVVVLAAGAVGTPVILERSGLGGGGVGRYLRLHPTTCVLGRYAHDISPLMGTPLSVTCDEFLRHDANGYGFWIQCPSLGAAMAAVAMGGFGASHRAAMRQMQRTAPLIALTRDGADLQASNGSVRIDRKGRTRIRYRLGPSDRAHVIAGIEAAARLHFAAGAREVVTLHTTPLAMTKEADLPRIREQRYGANDLSLFSAHVNGTCRMGTDPSRSGISQTGERHGVRGLYVADGSALPTALGVNPQETIMALSSVIAEGIVERNRQ
jgi:choline dehydrogenase-like flavoprotein